MKELLIKIRALFEGGGAEQAASSLDQVAESANKVQESTSGLDSSLGGASSSLGALGEASGEAGVGLNDLGGGLQNAGTSAGGGAFTGAIAGASAALVTFAIDVATKALVAVIQLGKAFAAGVLEIANFADKLVELSTKTGQSVGDLVVLQQAFDNIGLKAGDIGPVMDAVNSAISEAGNSASPAAAAFQALGIPIEQFSQMTAAEKLTALATGLAGVRDPATQAAIQTALFKDEAELLSQALADTSAFQTASQQVGSLAANMEKAAPALNSFADAYNSLDVKKQQFFAGAAAQFATELERAGVALNQLDLGALGEQVGILIRGSIEVGKEIAAWVEWVKQFTDALGITGPLIDGIKQGFMNALGPTGQLLEYLYSTGEAAVQTEEAQAAVTAEIEASRARAQELIDRMNENKAVALGTIDAIQQAGAEGVDGTAGAATDRINQGGEQARTGINDATTQGTQQIQLTAEQIQQAAQQLATAFQQGMGQDISPALQALVTSVQTSYQGIGTQIQATATQLQAALSPEAITVPLQTLTQTLTQFTQSMQQSMTELNTSVATLQSTLAPALTQLQTAVTTALPPITQGVTTLNSAITSANLPQMGTTLQTIGTSFQTFGQTFQSGIQSIQSSTQQVTQSVTQGFQQVAQAQSQMGQSVTQGVNNMVNAVKQGAQQIQQAVQSGLSGIGSAFASAVSGIWGAINALRNAVAALAARG
jgi:hypothetical protein